MGYWTRSKEKVQEAEESRLQDLKHKNWEREQKEKFDKQVPARYTLEGVQATGIIPTNIDTCLAEYEGGWE